MATGNKTQELTEVQTRTKTKTLTPLEEKVIRMRRGLKAPVNMALSRADEGHPELTSQVDVIEQRILEAAGTRSNPTKQKIVRALRHQ
tara:strand:+ start:410 stop:673 length:264 start_codon:yes stop_codon:yes gene_type:complete